MVRFTRRASKGIYSVIIAARGMENGIYFIISPGRGSGPVISIARRYRTFHDLLMARILYLFFFHSGYQLAQTTTTYSTPSEPLLTESTPVKFLVQWNPSPPFQHLTPIAKPHVTHAFVVNYLIPTINRSSSFFYRECAAEFQKRKKKKKNRIRCQHRHHYQ